MMIVVTIPLINLVLL